MIKQAINLLLITFILSAPSWASDQKLDKEHRCYQELCEGQILDFDEFNLAKIIMIVPEKSVLFYSESENRYFSVSWNRIIQSLEH